MSPYGITRPQWVNTLRLTINGCCVAKKNSNAFPWMKMVEFWLKIYLSVFLKLHLTNHLSQQAIIWTNDDLFIRPFEKRTYYAMAMSVRLSVRPSVRPSVRVFRTFFQHALRYQFETWYMHLVGGTTCRVWVSSQLGHSDLVYSQM